MPMTTTWEVLGYSRPRASAQRAPELSALTQTPASPGVEISRSALKGLQGKGKTGSLQGTIRGGWRTSGATGICLDMRRIWRREWTLEVDFHCCSIVSVLWSCYGVSLG